MVRSGISDSSRMTAMFEKSGRRMPSVVLRSCCPIIGDMPARTVACA
jgi:hypothetical protein